jgi:hypothetical protein
MEYPYGFPLMAEIVPETPEPEGDGFYIKHYEITDEEVQKQRARLDWTMRGLEPGTYCILKERRNGRSNQWMSDTWLERYTNAGALEASRGDVLILGLGIGLLPVACCRKEEVSSVTVLEIEPQIIRLVEPHIRHPKLTIIEGDAFHPPFRVRSFDTIYIDIWQDICSDNWETMKPLLRQYRYFGRNGAWVSAWLKDYTQREAQEDRHRHYW